jgi:transcriptional regulator with XRE-family HTH domain
MHSTAADTFIFGRRLKEARLAAGLSQQQLGVAAGIDPAVASTRVNRYERGIHMPDPRIVEALGQVLGLVPPYFYAVDDELAEFLYRYSKAPAGMRRELHRMVGDVESPGRSGRA